MGSIARSAASTRLAAYLKAAPVLARFAEVLGGAPQDAARYVASVLAAVAANPTLQACEPESVARAALQAATLRLDVSPQVAQAYLVPFRVKGRYQATLVVGYRGLLALALRTGRYTRIHAGPVYEGQRFIEDPLTGEARIEGRREGDAVVGYVAYYRMRDGFEKAVYMSVDDIRAHAERYSKSWGSRDSAWSTNFDDMARKTVLRRLLLRWGYLDATLQRVLTGGDVPEPPVVVEVDEPSEAELIAGLGYDTGAQPRAETTVTVAERPFQDAAALRAWLQRQVAERATFRFRNAEKRNGAYGIVRASLEGAGFDREERHLVLAWLFGEGFAENGPALKAALDWLKPVRDEETGDWLPDGKAVAEFRLALAAAREAQGQQTLPGVE